MQLDDAATILGNADFFEVCDHEQRRFLAFSSDRRQFEPGEVVYQSGDIPEGAHILVVGRLLATPDDETLKPYEINGAGTLIGTMSLVLAKPRPLTIVAQGAAETLIVPRNAFMKLARQYPDLAERAANRIRNELGSFMDAIEPVRGRMNKDIV